MKTINRYLFRILAIFVFLVTSGHAITCTTISNLDGATTPNAYAGSHNFDTGGSSVGNTFALGFPGDVQINANGYKGDSSTFPIRVKVGTSCGGSELSNTLVPNTQTYSHSFHFTANQNYYVTIEAATQNINGTDVTTQATDYTLQYVPDDAEAVLSMLIDDSEPAGGILINTPYTYSVSPKNSGNTDASNVTFRATVPSDITLTGASGPGWSCSNTATTVTCTMSNMPHDNTAKPLSITAQSSTIGTKRLTATLDSITHGPNGNPDHFDAIEDTTFYEHTNVLVGSKIDHLDASGNEVLTDTQFTYTLSMGNTGNYEAAGVVIEDILPDELIFVSASAGCSRSGQTVTCNLGTIPSNGSKSVDITVKTEPSLGGPLAKGILNTMTVTQAPAIADLSQSTARETTNIIERYTDLNVQVTGPDTKLIDDNYQYTIHLGNSGTITAENVKIVTQLTNGLIYRGPSPSGWNCSASGSTLTCNRTNNLAVGASENITIPVTAPGAPTQVQVQSVITTTTDTSTDNSTKSTDIISPEAHLNIVKAVSANQVVVGNNFTYTIEAENTGSATTNSIITVVDDLPAAVTYVSASGSGWTCSYSNPRVQCTHPALTAGETTNLITITVTATNAAQNVLNTAIVSDTDGHTDSDWAEIDIDAAGVGLNIEKTASGDREYLVGENFEYYLDVSNGGNIPANNLTVTDILPTEVTYVSATGTGWTCGYDGGTRTVTCTRPTLGVGAQSRITITATATTPGTAVQNCSDVADSGGNTGSNGDECVRIDILAANTDLHFNGHSIWHTGTDPDIAVGDWSYWYYMEIRNTGTVDATNVTLSMDLPPEVTYYQHTIWNHTLSGDGRHKLDANKISNSHCSMVGQKFTCTFPTVPVTTRPDYRYDGIQVLLYVKNLPITPMTLTTTAYINETTTQDDTYTFNSVIKIPETDLKLTVNDPPRGTVFTDQNYNYFMKVKNRGGERAKGLTLRHTLPDGYSYKGYQKQGNTAHHDWWTCNYDTSSRIFTCKINSNTRYLEVDKNFKVKIKVTSSSTPGDKHLLFNLDVDSAMTTDTTPDNNEADYYTEVVARTGAISVEKTSPTPVYINESFIYNVAVDNIGDAGSELRDVNLTDVLPAGVTYNSATGPGWTCNESGGTLTCNNPTIHEGDGVSIIDINVTAPSSDTNITNTATIDAIINDLNETENNSSSVDTEVLTRYPELVAYKVGTQNPVTVERPYSYYLGVQNLGNTIAENVTFTDILPKDMNYTGFSGSTANWTCTDPAHFTNQTVSCTYNVALQVNAFQYVRIDVLAPTTEGNITNRVDVNTTTLEAVTTNNFAEVNTSILPEYADLRLSQFDTPDPVTAGAYYEYNVTVDNLGDADAESVVLTDTLDNSVIYTAFASVDDWSCSHNGAVTLTCTKATAIPSGGSSSFIIHVRAPSSAGTVNNNITVTTSTPEVVTNNNNSLEITTIEASTLVGFFPFELRANYILSGDVSTIGNTVLCEKVNGVCNPNTSVDNASVSLDYVVDDVNISGDLTTPPFNATSATLTLPVSTDPSDPTEVIWAGLYWQGMTNNGSSEDNDTQRQEVYLKNELNSYVRVQADDYHVTNVYKLGKTNYAAMADVTDTVKAFGAGKYTVANLNTSNGLIYGVGAYGAWSLVVVYYDPDSDEIRNLSVFDGWQVITSDPAEGNSVLSIPLSGFRTPKTGNVDAKLSIFTAEGDADIGGDTLQAKSGTTSYTSLQSVNGRHPGPNNVMNSSISGVPLRSPNLNNNNGIDIQNYDIGTTAGAARILTNNDTVLQVKMATSGLDTYFPSMMTMSVELLKPDICYDYSIRQDGLFLDVDFPLDNRRPDLNMSLTSQSPMTFNIYFKNREGDIAATDLSMYTDFDMSPEDLQIKYIEDSVRKTDVNGSSYYDYLDSDSEVDAITPDVRIAMGNNPTDAHNGGFLSVGENQYLQFKVAPQTSHLEMPLRINLGMVLLFDDGYTMDLPRYRLGKDIKPCLPSQSYNPVWGQFTVIDKLLNPDFVDDTAEVAHFKYNLRTQVSNRPYAIDLVSLKKNTNNADLPSDWEPLEANTTVHIELADLTEFNELNASCGDSFNAIPGTSEFVEFLPNEWRKPLSITSTPYAKRNLTYRIWFLEDNGSLVQHQCGVPGSTPGCYQALYNSIFASESTFCASSCSSNEADCYECLRGRYGKALCSRDNFSIRPEALDIDNLKDVNMTTIKVPKVGPKNDQHIAARSFYRLDINATGYNYKNDGSHPSTLRGVPGYSQRFPTPQEATANFEWYEDPGVTCNDEENLSLELAFANRHDIPNHIAYSYSESNQSTPNVGKYRISLRDINWTGVDKYQNAAHHHLGTRTGAFFLQAADISDGGVDDCVLDDTETPKVGFARTNNDYRVGCDFASQYTKKADPLQGVVAYDFNDSNITSHPDNIIFNNNTDSNWRASQYLSNTDNTFIYMNNVLESNESLLTMAGHLETRLRAVDENNVTLSNFTSSCYAQGLDMNFSIRTWSDTVDRNISMDYRLLALDNSGHYIPLSSDDSNRSIDYNGTVLGDRDLSVYLPDIVFADDLNGTARVQLHMNINRETNVPQNPYRVQFQDINLTCAREAISPLIPLNDCNITNNGETKLTHTLLNLNDKNVTFIYGRVHAPRYRVVGNEANVTLYYEAYCDVPGGCTLLDVINSGSPAKHGVDSVNWYQNDIHNENFDGNISTTLTQHRSPAKVMDYGTNNSSRLRTLTYLDDKFPYRTVMEINTSNWLLYNRYDNNATTNSFDIEFNKKGDDITGTVDSNAAVNSNRRIMW